jgi:hypothetical protein
VAVAAVSSTYSAPRVGEDAVEGGLTFRASADQILGSSSGENMESGEGDSFLRYASPLRSTNR